jgi:O-antigen biosynthesis protein
MSSVLKERWDIRLQLARLDINAGRFDSSFAISRDLLLEKKDNPSASGLLILSLTKLDRYSDLFEYIDAASERALSADWAILAFANGYKLSSTLDTLRMLSAIDKISLSRAPHYRLWSVRLKRIAGFVDEALQELKDLGSAELPRLDYETELKQILTLMPASLYAKNSLFKKHTIYKLVDEPVDIIVPIYNAFEDTSVCLERLHLYTHEMHRVYLIDDASTDRRIEALCLDFCKKRKNAKFIKQQINKGFICSVNLGLEQAKGHVVLLNTDAYVPENWIDRLLFPILNDSSVATVTPMTNNGEIANIPTICKVIQLAPDLADQVDMVAQQFDPLEVLTETPTGVGFCMAMSRHWLDKVNRLDTSFGHGYGEEVDWCQRVRSLGGKHILTGGVFVEHRGGMSFNNEKQARIIANNKIIAQRYPAYNLEVQEFIRNDPAISTRLALALAMIGTEGEVPVFLAHRWGGGAEIWLKDIIQQRVKDNRSSVVVRGVDSTQTVSIELHSVAGVTQGNVCLNALHEYIGILPHKELIYSCLVATEDPLVLIDCLIKNMGYRDRLRILFHDYFPICPSYTLIGKDKVYCGIPNESECENCFTEINKKTGSLAPNIARWRSKWLCYLKRAYLIEVFSQSSLNIVLSTWPTLKNKVEVKPHKVHILQGNIKTYSNNVPVVGVLGAIGYQKGAAIIKELAEISKDRLNIIVVGEIDPAFKSNKIVVHGKYTPDMILSLIDRYSIDRWLIPSIWPETFSFTTHECLATGLPVFAFDLGGQGDAVRHSKRGRLIPIETNVNQLLEILCEKNMLII